MKRLIVSRLMTFAVLILFGMISDAGAAPVTITYDDLSVPPVVFGGETSQNAIDAVIATYLGSSYELYKANAGTPIKEEYSLAGSYATTFYPENDPEDAEIMWTGGNIVGPVAYLLLKDGNANPAWYLYNLTLLGWHGSETITIDGFWPNQGAISHITLYGGGETTAPPVPVPPTVWLLGSGLVGLVGLRRRFSRPTEAFKRRCVIMKKLLALLILFITFVAVTPVMASTVTIQWTDGYYTSPGGEFTLTGDIGAYLPHYNSVAVVGGGIQSFCLEKNEYVSIGKTYNFVENTGAVNGGVGGPDPDPLSVGAAYLYYQFSKGALAGYDYTLANRAASAEALQNAIWYLEQEGGALSDPMKAVLLAEFGALSTLTDWMKDNKGKYPVMVLNLTSKNSAGATIYNQDQLATVGNVPIPPTVYLLGGGLLGLVGLRRKFKR